MSSRFIRFYRPDCPADKYRQLDKSMDRGCKMLRSQSAKPFLLLHHKSASILMPILAGDFIEEGTGSEQTAGDLQTAGGNIGLL